VLGPSQWLHETSLPKRVHHHFWPEFYPSQVQLFWLNLIGPSQKEKLKLWRLPKEEHPMERWSASPLAHIYK